MSDLKSSPNPEPASILLAREAVTSARTKYRSSVRNEQKLDDIARDEKQLSLLNGKPGALFNSIKTMRKSQNTSVKRLNVSDKVYRGE